MHELSIATEILRTCREVIAERGGGRLESAKVAVGELTAIEPELLRFAWQALLADGPDAAATLEIEWRGARQHCPACGDAPERVAGSWLRLCPRCGDPLTVEGGSELDVLQVSFVALESGGESHG